MAVNLNRQFMNNTGLDRNNCLTNLLNSISPSTENETDIINHSKYYDSASFKNVLNGYNTELGILNLNCRSLNANFDKLKLFLADVDTRSQITCITLQETWQKENDSVDFYVIPGYTLISDCYRITSHGGVAIYLRNDFSYKKISIGNESTLYEIISLKFGELKVFVLNI